MKKIYNPIISIFCLAISSLLIAHNHTKIPLKEFNSIIQKITTNFDSDSISAGIWRSTVDDIVKVDTHGSIEQKALIESILDNNEKKIEQSIKNIVFSTLQNSKVLNMLGSIAQGIITGVLPTVSIQALQILSGNLDLETAGPELLNAGILSALSAIIWYVEHTPKTPLALAGFQTGLTSNIMYQWIKNHENIQSAPALTSGLQWTLSSVASSVALKEINAHGGIGTLIQKIEWLDPQLTKEEQILIEQKSEVYNFITNNLQMIVQNKTVRNTTAEVVTYALEGALIGSILYACGLGFEGETIAQTINSSMVRGAFEGLFHASTREPQSIGVLKRIGGGFVGNTMKNYLTSGMQSTRSIDITPIMLQQIIKGAMQSLVRQSGGWGNTMKYLYGFGKSTIFG